MTVDWASIDWAKTVAAAASALAAIATLVRFFSGPSRTHARLDTESEILARLIPGTDLHDSMTNIVRGRIAELSDAPIGRRDIPMLVVSVIVAPALAYASIWLIQQNEWWAWVLFAPTVAFAVLFIYGIFETAAAVPRDAKGKRIEADDA